MKRHLTDYFGKKESSAKSHCKELDVGNLESKSESAIKAYDPGKINLPVSFTHKYLFLCVVQFQSQTTAVFRKMHF